MNPSHSFSVPLLEVEWGRNVCSRLSCKGL